MGVLVGPTYVWLTLTIVLPLAAMLYFSFLTEAPLGGNHPTLTLANYADFFTKDFYQVNAWRSLTLGVHVTLGCVVLGYPAALGLAQVMRGRWREALILLIVVPFWSNLLVRTFSWAIVLRRGGVLDQAIQAAVPDAPSLNLLFTYPAVVIGLVHTYLPYMILTCYVSLQAIDGSLVEAARSLGASWWRIFTRITLPLSLPGLLSGIILIFVPTIGSFMEPRILGGTEATMLGPLIEHQFTAVFNWPLGAALSFVLLAIVLAILAASYPLLRTRLEDL